MRRTKQGLGLRNTWQELHILVERRIERQTGPETIFFCEFWRPTLSSASAVSASPSCSIQKLAVRRKLELSWKLYCWKAVGLRPRRIELRTPGTRSGKLEEDQINLQQIGIHLHFSRERMLVKPYHHPAPRSMSQNDERIVCPTTCGFWFPKAIHFLREGVDWGYLKQVFWSNVDALSFVSDNRENAVKFVFMGVILVFGPRQHQPSPLALRSLGAQ